MASANAGGEFFGIANENVGDMFALNIPELNTHENVPRLLGDRSSLCSLRKRARNVRSVLGDVSLANPDPDNTSGTINKDNVVPRPLNFEIQEPPMAISWGPSIIPKGVEDDVVDENDDEPPCAFIPEGDAEQEWDNLLSEIHNPSYKNDNWARNKFRKWRKHMKLDHTVEIEKIPLKTFGEELVKFFLMLCKNSGERYPTVSIMNFFMGFNRILIMEQKRRIIETGIVEPQFCIQSHPWFLGAGRAVLRAMELSRNSGVNKDRRKVDALSYEDEIKILSHPLHQANYPDGVHMRFAYYCFVVFLIRGNTKLYNLLLKDFELGTDERGFTYLK